MSGTPPLLLAQALGYLAEGTDEPTAVRGLVSAAEGSRRVLEGAYARALALVNELPADPKARAVVDLLSKALRHLAGGIAPIRRD
jgi:hypothetical protein